MKKSIWTTGLLVLLAGCGTMNNTEGGALGGAVLGGVTGAIVGAAATRNPLGALIGAGIGAGAGGLGGAAIGHAEDKAQERSIQNYEQAKANAIAAAQNPPVGLQQIADMTHQRLSDDVIIAAIHNSGSTYILYTPQITWMKQQGISDRVILYMQTRPPMIPRPAPVIVGPPPPPVAVGFGVGIR